MTQRTPVTIVFRDFEAYGRFLRVVNEMIKDDIGHENYIATKDLPPRYLVSLSDSAIHRVKSLTGVLVYPRSDNQGLYNQ